METQQYTFTAQKGDHLASFDEAGGAIEVFLPEFVDYFEHTVPGNWSEIVREFIIGVLIHEDIHVAISNSNENWTVHQEHQCMEELFHPCKT